MIASSLRYWIIALSFLPFALYAQDEDWGDEWGNDWSEEKISSWSYDGFIELAQGGFLQNNVVESSSSLSEIRARLNFDYSHQYFEIKAKGDAYYDNVLEKDIWNTRELYIGTSFSIVDIKAGRQVLTWGTGDYVFLNDLFAKDWQSFFSGREDEYLKAPSDSLRITTYLGKVTFDLAYTPELTPDNYLTGERFSFYSPAADANIAPAENFNVEQTDDEQWAMRIATSVNSVEYSLYGYKGFWTTPVGVDLTGTPYFPEMNALGASMLTPLAGGLFNTEASYYQSTEDKKGDNASIANSQSRLLIGYEREAAKNFTVGTQFYVEKIEDYDAYEANHLFPEQIVDEYRQLLTLRLRYSAMQQTLIYSLFTFYSPTDKDAYLKPSITYRYNDNLFFAAGANLFWGDKPFTFFGQHEDNSNAWLRIRYTY